MFAGHFNPKLQPQTFESSSLKSLGLKNLWLKSPVTINITMPNMPLKKGQFQFIIITFMHDTQEVGLCKYIDRL